MHVGFSPPSPEPRTILFVCTGNIFRSMSAEHLLRAFLPACSPLAAASAGTTATPQAVYPPVAERLAQFGVDASGHRQRRLTEALVEEAALVVAMGTDHQRVLREQFGVDAPLFMDVACGRPIPIRDLHEVLPDARPAERAALARATVDLIRRAIPGFVRSLDAHVARPHEVRPAA